MTVDIPSEADPAAVLALVSTYDGPLAIAIGRPRCDEVDAVLRTVDEVVVVQPPGDALSQLVEQELRPVVARLAIVPPPRSPLSVLFGGDSGQSTVVVLAIIALVLAVASGLGLVASALGRASTVQGRADVAALSAAQAMLDAQPLLYTADDSQQITEAEFRRRGIAAAMANGDANGLRVRDVVYVDDDGKPLRSGELPTRVRITALSADADGRRDRVVRSTAEVAVAALDADGGMGTGDYTGPLAVRQGQRMRPDVALAFDRMAAAARRSGIALVITSGYRSDAEQAELFRRHPDPKWVARPGTSLHRLGTELDLGPNAAWGWLAANSGRFGFIKRYAWEDWHFGFVRSAGSASVGFKRGAGASRSAGSRSGSVATKAGAADQDAGGSAGSGDAESERTSAGGGSEKSGSAIPAFVPARYAPMISRAAQRWSVGAALLGAQLSVESNFNPNAQSGAGAGGIAQFMPGTAAMYGLSPAERFDPAKAIDAQGHLMHDLLRQFASVPLALAAYNAGGGAVAKCMCIPPFPETQAYVQKILGLLAGAGIAAPAGLQIRLVA